LKHLGHRVARSTVAAILKEQGVPPSGARPTSWQTFLRAHWRAIVAADFFTTEVWMRLFLCDRDRKWSLAGNAHAERFVRSIKEECLNRLIPLGARHFRRTMGEYVMHYHRERNHQGLGNELIENCNDRQRSGSVRKRERLGGLLSYYHRARSPIAIL
jgi:hypothetical protein